MAQAAPQPSDCCTSCQDPIVENIPGPQGEQGEPGQDGCTGTNAWTLTTDDFVMPASGNNVTIDVGQSAGFAVGAPVYVENAGTFEVITIPSDTELQIQNLGYTENAPALTNIPIQSRVTQTGWKGVDGTSGGGDLLAANNLSDVDNVATSRTNLGGTTVGVNLFTLTNPGAITFLRVNADNTVSALSAAAYRTALSLVVGTDVQAFDAFLTSIATLGTAADRIIYTTGVNVAAETPLTAYARTLLDDATAVAARATLGNVLPRYGLLGSATGVDANSANTDTAISIESTNYRIDKIVVWNASTSLTTATAGVYTQPAAAGTEIAAVQALSALTASEKFDDLTLQAVAGTDLFTAVTIYFRIATAQGGAATLNVAIYGYTFS